jgi:hypothetical protein
MSGTHSLKPIDEGEEMTAVITEAQRFEMHTCLRGLMGEEVANTMMEHLPPSGWSDVARKSDVIQIQKDIDRLQGEIHSVRNSVWSSLGITASIMLGQMALIIYKIP